MTIKKTLICLTLSAAFLNACSPDIYTHGHQLNQDKLNQIVVGTTSKAEVQQLLGSPSTIAPLEGKTWYYITKITTDDRFITPTTIDQRGIAIHFDAQDRVAAIESKDKKDQKAVQMVTRTTPTAGQDMSILEQFAGNIGRFNKGKKE